MTGRFIFIATNRLKPGMLDAETARVPGLVEFVHTQGLVSSRSTSTSTRITGSTGPIRRVQMSDRASARRVPIDVVMASARVCRRPLAPEDEQLARFVLRPTVK